ncbi:MAG: hypothetical protein KJP00_11550 [Bacteroidia bacterium]|nr:hypothetical protein [Bacteroidia bacterium]
MMKSTAKTIFIAIVALLLFSACSKDEKEIFSNQIGKIISTTYILDNSNTPTDTFIITEELIYDQDTLRSIISDFDEYEDFYYHNGNIVAKFTYRLDNYLLEVDSFFYDGQERLELVKLYDNRDSLFETTQIFYSNNTISHSSKYNIWSNPNTRNWSYQYSGNNIIKTTWDIEDYYLEYEYYDQLTNLEFNHYLYNILSIQSFSLSIPYIESMNLIKSEKTFSDGQQEFQTNWEYNFNNDRLEKITSDWFWLTNGQHRQIVKEFIYRD